MQGSSILSAPLSAVKAVNKANQRSDYPPSFRTILEYNGDKKIKGIVIGRNVLSSKIQSIINAVATDKAKEKLKEQGYDKLFHLFIVVFLEGGTKVRMERNQVLSASTSVGKVEEQMNFPVNKDITLNDFLEKAHQAQGSEFFHYSAQTNNCQDFVLLLLSRNGLLTDSIRKFVKQDTAELTKPFFSKVADVITDTAATVDKAIHGQGMHGGKGMNCKF